MEKNTALAALTTAQRDLNQARGAVLIAVLAARKSGISWAAIAAPLEMTKQAAQQKYGRFVQHELEVEDRYANTAKDLERDVEALAKRSPSTLVDPDVAGQSVTPSIFLEPKAPAKPIYEPLPAYTNPHGWEAGSWMQDDPRHFLVNDKVLRPEVCPFCKQKSHASGSGTWIYDACIPTWADPSYYEN